MRSVYPRTHGEHQPLFEHLVTECGLSPYSRGTQSQIHH
ncbi:protein of unknown function [Xenorhabdus doucetiae]|uniref:Uncharacterized protein n=1 Tax=Xenorhabdus doucetiae TaxID=351671 RepID=A0A068QSF3_9GAMM|nr:protein of unknown function [Xenorhabdus doucetiae]